MKGVSPLIAAVLLIVFTILIAGILASFATSLSREQIEKAGKNADCIGSLDMSSLRVDEANKIISFRLRNTGKISLDGFTALVEFTDVTDNHIYDLGSKVGTLLPTNATFVNFDYSLGGSPSKPTKIEVVSSICPSNGVVLAFI